MAAGGAGSHRWGAGHFLGSCSHAVVVGTNSRQGKKNHSFSLERFIKILLDLEQWTHSSSAPRELRTRAGHTLQQGFCFEIFPPAWLGRSPVRGAGLQRSSGSPACPSPGASAAPCPGHPGLATPCTPARAWVHTLLSTYP